MNFAQSLRFLLLPSLKATQQEFKTWKNEKKQEGLLGKLNFSPSFRPLFSHIFIKKFWLPRAGVPLPYGGGGGGGGGGGQLSRPPRTLYLA